MVYYKLTPSLTLSILVILGRPYFIYSWPLTKNEEDTSQHPYFNGSQALCLRGIGGYVVKYVDQDQEQSNQQRHPTCKVYRNPFIHTKMHHDKSV